MSRHSVLGSLAFMMCVAAACADAGAPTAGSSAAASGAGAKPSASADAEGPAATVDEAAVKKLVEAWVAAQNQGDFAAYQKLYAEKLEGIKRAGQRTWRFDRKGFLADRERMFRKPMTVEAKDVSVRPSAVSAVVELKQRFKQDKFEDEGPKRLVVVLENGALKIAREEMLSSTLASGGSGAQNQPVRFVLGDAGKSYVFIGDGDASWASGPAKMLSAGLAGADFAAMRSAEKAPASAKSWKSRAISLYDGAGKSCEATIVELHLIAAGTPHFGEVQMWDGAVMNGKPTQPVLGEAARATAVFGMARPYLVGELDVPDGCAPALAIESKAPPKFFATTQVGANDAAAQAAQDAFRKLASYQDAQSRFAKDFQGKGDWTKTVTLRGYEGHSRRFISVSAEELAGCADFNASANALFEVTGASKVVLVAEGAGVPDTVFDSDGDGKVEITVGNRNGGVSYLVQSGSEMTAASSLDFPYNDCPC